MSSLNSTGPDGTSEGSRTNITAPTSVDNAISVEKYQKLGHAVLQTLRDALKAVEDNKEHFEEVGHVEYFGTRKIRTAAAFMEHIYAVPLKKVLLLTKISLFSQNILVI